MNFLALCQSLVEKAGISGSITTTVSQTGEMLRVVNWVNEAWFDLQLKRTHWDWMRYDFTLQTVALQRSYAPADCTDVESNAAIANFSKWHKDTFRIFKTSVGKQSETPLEELPYLVFRDTYQLGQEQVGPPDSFAVRPRGKLLLLGPIPDDVYTVYGEYQRSATHLSGDADEPDLPAQYHMLIVHLAREKYATYENAPEVLAEASADADRLFSALSETQTEDVTLGDPLA